MWPFRRRKGRGAGPGADGIAPRRPPAGLLKREQRALLKAREEKLRDLGQEYCIDCGLRLPLTQGAVPRLRRGWVRRFGWYPGDWIWFALVTLAVAGAGAVLAIRYGGSRSSPGAETVIAPRPRPAPV